MMHRYIYKPNKGKDFYRNELEYFEYKPKKQKTEKFDDEEDLEVIVFQKMMNMEICD